LSAKHYQTAPKLNSPDFVLLFIPIESSFGVAIQEDQDLFSFAWDLKVVLVSPSTLLATLRTIASIWQQENQTRNALEIARQSGALYDKFVGFISDMEKIGKSIEQLKIVSAKQVLRLFFHNFKSLHRFSCLGLNF
jgi:DNA recombination protein RmuC